MNLLRTLGLTAAALFAPLAASGEGIQDPKALRAFARLTADEWKAVGRGEVQAKLLETRQKHEVAVVGVARVRAAASCFADRFQDIETFKRNPAVLRIQKLTPLDPRAFADFALETRDISDLRDCRVGECKLKFSAPILERIHREVDWSRSGHEVEVQSVIRQELARYIDAYSQQGDSALLEYRDKSKPVPLAREFAEVLYASPGLGELAPEFREYLARYPRASLPGVSEFFYWSREAFGLKPVTSVTHVSMFVQKGRVVTASKQLYASHYFEASLGLAVALDDPGNSSNPGMYLLYLNRSRIDLLGGFSGALRRLVMRGRLQDGMRKNMVDVVRSLESSCAHSPNADRTP